MGHWQPKYSDRQRRAIQQAYCDRAIRPVSQIVRLAGMGELICDGERVEAFEIPQSTAVAIGRAEERRRTGKASSRLVSQPPGDAVEILRRRLVSLLDRETLRLEHNQKRHHRDPMDAQQLQRVGRALRELAALPRPGAAQGPRPDARTTTTAEASPSSLAGEVIAAMAPAHAPTDRINGASSADRLPSSTNNGGMEEERGGVGERQAAQAPHAQADNAGDEAPGARSGDSLVGLRASSIRVEERAL